MYKDQEKQRTVDKRHMREFKSNLYNSAEAQDDSNRAYGFRLQSNVDRRPR